MVQGRLANVRKIISSGIKGPRSFLPNSGKSRLSRLSPSCRRTCYSDGQQVSSEFITCWGMSPTSFTHLSSQPPSSSFFLVDIMIISNLITDIPIDIITDLTVLNQYKYKVDIRPVHKNLFWNFQNSQAVLYFLWDVDT